MSITPEQLIATQQRAQEINNRILRLSVRKEAVEQAIAQREAQGIALYGTADYDKLTEQLAAWEAANAEAAAAFQKEVDETEAAVVALEEALAALDTVDQ